MKSFRHSNIQPVIALILMWSGIVVWGNYGAISKAPFAFLLALILGSAVNAWLLAPIIKRLSGRSGQEVKTDFEFIKFFKVPSNGKTPKYTCVNKFSGVQLGEVQWYPKWRQYCYFPTCEAVYSKGCLVDISVFIHRLTVHRKPPQETGG